MDTHHRAHLLLIDDKPDELCPLITLLGAAGFKVSQACTAQQGYQRAIALRPDLIILDLYMSKMDGFSVCRLLNRVPGYELPPVIFLSSSCRVEDRLQGFELGAVDFVSKPFSAEEMLARIKTHLRLCRKMNSRPQTIPVASAIDEEEVILDTAIQFIEQQITDPPPLETIARSVGTYEKRLLQVFRKHLGVTVFAFIRQIRLQKARELLANELISIENIAAAVGFSSAANFATAFKSHEGLTPREYRNRLRRKTDETVE